MAEPRGDETVELLQTLIRNACVNDGHMDSGQEIRNADVLTTYLEGAGVEVQQYHAAPGRTSLVARIEGTDPDAPSLCLNGHTDVVPISPDGWDEASKGMGLRFLALDAEAERRLDDYVFVHRFSRELPPMGELP